MQAVADMPIAKQMAAVASVTLVGARSRPGDRAMCCGGSSCSTSTRRRRSTGSTAYASPTPVIADGRVVCHFGAMGTACVDASTGDVLWRRQLEINHIVGPGSSPVVHDELVILTCDGGDKQFIAALDLDDGRRRVESRSPADSRDEPRHAKGVLHAAGDRGRRPRADGDPRRAVVRRVRSGDRRGAMARRPRQRILERAAADLRRRRCCTSTRGSARPQLWAVRVDGSGDVSDTHVAWRQTQQMPTMSSPVMADGRIYVDQRRRRGELPRRRDRRGRVARARRRASTPPRRCWAPAASTSAATRAARPSSRRPTSSRCSPRTISTAGSWRRPPWWRAIWCCAPIRTCTASRRSERRGAGARVVVRDPLSTSTSMPSPSSSRSTSRRRPACRCRALVVVVGRVDVDVARVAIALDFDFAAAGPSTSSTVSLLSQPSVNARRTAQAEAAAGPTR